jgi:large subunit ribosomal protein L17
MANLLKSLIIHGRLKTTPTKAKELRKYADRMITLAKEDTLHSKRRARAQMMIRFNPLSPKDRSLIKEGKNLGCLNDDRKVLGKLFTDLKTRFATRQGGYTRVLQTTRRVGDGAKMCFIEFVE